MQQTTNQDAPAAPRAPQAPTAVTTTGGDGKPITILIPQTDEQVVALRARREELSNQLQSVTQRRAELAQEINSAEGASKAGLEARLKVLDQRIVQLESDIAATGQAIAGAPNNLLALEQINPNPGNGDEWGEGMAVGMGTALFGLGMVAVFRRFRRRRKGVVSGSVNRALPDESAQRLERVEHAVEAIAIEVERISEGQRFVTKLLAENHQSPVTIPAGKS
ncbi:MAG TPA: hypothetical protein VM099_04095 [Gemmatimonadaceae bacterium]|nr:hypothetical protein [Gemmatimonadaceae bacterium]